MESEHLGQELNDQDRVLLIFGYLGPLALVALVASRREFVKWHAKQGLLLTILWFLLWSVFRMFQVLLDESWLAAPFWTAAWMVALGVLIMMAVCIVRGLEGERFKVPGIGSLADRL